MQLTSPAILRLKLFITKEYTTFRSNYFFEDESIAWSCFTLGFKSHYNYNPPPIYKLAGAFLISINASSYKDFIILANSYDVSSLLSILIHNNPGLSSHEVMLLFDECDLYD